MSAVEVEFDYENGELCQGHLFRIVDPCGRVISKKNCSGPTDSQIWLKLVQIVRKDPFLAVERFNGTLWLCQSEADFYCCV